ncbi:hypothetical protein [Actomonas aquatica]|uniref:Holin n=1 Tax=Actomonas aquatica TaxID=2866162 RepID=A0ABZ1CDM7_9BACT|nr:hypothetical protein [Opitutus sp. WL0086]WRQ89392.1 hypothetical protein K1X11_008220 [Opitutus sp. WL0086]
MKRSSPFRSGPIAWLIAALFLAPVMLFAQEAVDSVATAAGETALALTWQQALIPVLTPLIIGGVRWLLPKIPKVWLPLAAPVIGLLIDLVSHFTMQTDINPTVALALGAAGVGLREAKKQLSGGGTATTASP